MVSLGHAAYFGVAAYALALISPKYEAANLWLTLPAAMAAAALAALDHRLFRRAHRRRLLHHGHTRLCANALLDLSRHQTRRRLRRYLHQRAAGAEHRGIQAARSRKPGAVLLFGAHLVGACLTLSYIDCCTRPLAAPWPASGSTNSACAPSAYPVFAYKLGAFVLAGALAGLAGYLAACQFGFVNPDILAWHQSGIVLMMVILGGMGRLHGAVLGAFAYVLLQEIFSAPALLGAYAKHWQLAMGSLIVVIVLVFCRMASAVSSTSPCGGFRTDRRTALARTAHDATRFSKSTDCAKASVVSPPSTTYRSKSGLANCTQSSVPTAPARRLLINLIVGRFADELG